MNALTALLALAWQGLTNLMLVSIFISAISAILITFVGLCLLRVYQHTKRHQRLAGYKPLKL